MTGSGAPRLPMARSLVADRRRSLAWWTGSLVVVVALVALSYTTVAGEQALEDSFGDLPESVRVLLGVDDGALSLTAPAGYLNSQLFANFLPILLTVFAIGLGARAVAGDESDGTLELVLSHPVARSRLALERALAGVAMVVGLGVVAAATLVATAPLVDLDVGVGPMTAATATSVLLAVLHGAVAFGAGAATGRRGVAIAAGAGLTGAGFLVQSLATLADALRPLRWLSPWQWFLDDPAIVGGWSAVVVPGLAAVAAATLVGVAGTIRFARRDLGHG